MGVGEEAGRVGDDLGDGESVTRVGAGDAVDRESGLEGAGQAAVADAALVVALRVGEGDAGGAGAAAGRLVDVRGRVGGGDVGAADVDQGDVLWEGRVSFGVRWMAEREK